MSLILLQAAHAAADATTATNAATAPAAAATASPIGSPVTAYWPVMIFFVFAVAFPVLPIVLGRLLRPSIWQKDKMRPYECGIDPTTEAHDRFTVRYYIVAMLFLVFDVETIFLLPWAIIFMGDDFSFTKFALIEMLVFIGILVLGYYYAWRKGALEWA
ncbi:MAG TPA: NADH-quinone oxidoreductase subunit A [Pyrinomonadaceae bacterium]